MPCIPTNVDHCPFHVARTLTKLTPRMQQVLGHISRGDPPSTGCHGMSEHGGLTRVLGALESRGLIEATGYDWTLTEAGQEAVKREAGELPDDEEQLCMAWKRALP